MIIFMEYLEIFTSEKNCFMLIIKIYFSLVGIITLGYLLLRIPRVIMLSLKQRRWRGLVITGVLFVLMCSPFTRTGLILISALIYGLNAVMLLFYCVNRLFRKKREISEKEDDFNPTITVVFTVKNEETVISESISRALILDYPQDKLDVVVIDDNSTDNTRGVLQRFSGEKRFRLYRNTGTPGKASAINNFMGCIKSDLVLFLDADHHIPRDYLKKSVPEFRDPELGMIQGELRIRNGGKSILARMVEVEYYAFYQIFYASRLLTVYLGTGAVFRREALSKAGLFNNDICTEDMEMSFRIHQQGYKLLFSNRFSTSELAPTTVSLFRKQRYRWIRGTWQAFAVQFRKMLSSGNVSLLKKIDFLQIGITPFFLLSYFALNIFYVLGIFNFIAFPFSFNILYFFHLAIPVFYFFGLCWAGKLKYFFHIFLIPVYYLLYSFPGLDAVIDEFFFCSSFKGLKAERSSENV